jgi:Uma2 family endonuclease
MQNYEMKPKEGFKEKRRCEILNGKIYAMARPSINHITVAGNIHRKFGNFLKGKKCRTFMEADVHLSADDTVIPDVMIICNKDIIKKNGIHGAPDLIVEVLSPSTAERDISYKKDLYAKHGVKEYWIISTAERSIQVYLLNDGVYKLSKIYQVYEDWYIEGMDEEEIAAIVTEFKLSLDGFEDLIINVEEVFENVE